MRVKSSESFSISKRFSGAMRGKSSLLTQITSTRSCSTLLCLRLCIKAVGATLGSLVRKIAVPGTRVGFDFASIADQFADRDGVAMGLYGQQMRAANPGPHHDHRASREQQRHPAAILDLHQIGREEGEIDREEAGDQQNRGPQRPTPSLPHDDESQRRRRHHRAGHGDAIGRGQRRGAFEHKDENQHADQAAAD